MDFELSDDQVALRDAARDLLDDEASATRVRATFDATAAPDGRCWAQIVEQGWLAVEVPEADGGLGMGAVEVAVLAEEVGRHAAPVPFVSCVLARAALAAAGDVRADAIVSGDAVGSVAWWNEKNAVSAAREGDRWVLSGRPDPVPWAPIASVCVIAARDGGDLGLYAVDLDATGRPGAEPAMDRTRSTGWVHLDRTAAERIGDADAVERYVVDRGAVFTAAELLGGADTAMSMAVDYAKERVQFNRPIGSFQAVKHRCADMLVDVEGMRSTVYWAAWALAADDADQSVAASTAKTWCSDAAKRVMASSLQVHGGIGFTWEHDLHFFMKRSQLEQLRFGDAGHHRDRLAALLRPRVEGGASVI